MQSSEQEGNEAVKEKEEIMKDQVNTEEKTERDAALVPEHFPVPNSNGSQGGLRFLCPEFYEKILFSYNKCPIA